MFIDALPKLHLPVAAPVSLQTVREATGGCGSRSARCTATTCCCISSAAVVFASGASTADTRRVAGRRNSRHTPVEGEVSDERRT
jgi:hypothetical protein